MKAIGCLLFLVIGLVLFVAIAGWRMIRTLLGYKGSPSAFFHTVNDMRKNVKQMQEQMRQDSFHTDNARQQKTAYHNETSQRRTDSTSPGTKKIIPDDEGEYVSYEEIKK